jgi:hypothetical protein
MAHENDVYQWKLRSLGAYLDERKAYGLSLIESAGGFAVRYFRESNEREPNFEQLNDTQLRAFQAALVKRRSPSEGSKEEEPAPGRYQDFLRALGWELDDTTAFNIVLDELEQAFYLTYVSYDPPAGTAWNKRMANLGPGEKHAILRDARGRRTSVQPTKETADPT